MQYEKLKSVKKNDITAAKNPKKTSKEDSDSDLKEKLISIKPKQAKEDDQSYKHKKRKIFMKLLIQQPVFKAAVDSKSKIAITLFLKEKTEFTAKLLMLLLSKEKEDFMLSSHSESVKSEFNNT